MRGPWRLLRCRLPAMSSVRPSRPVIRGGFVLVASALLLAGCGRGHAFSSGKADAAVSPDVRDAAKDSAIGIYILLDAVLAPTCGNRHPDIGEACDDGNTASGDGCSTDCRAVEPGWRCPVWGQACSPICGDGLRVGSESCDDGNTTSGDGCSHLCLTEPGWDCSSGACIHPSPDGGLGGAGDPPVCGDGITSGAEACDDGPLNNDTAYGGCTTQCRLGPYCGDDRIDPGELCDMGSLNGKAIYFSDVTDAGTETVVEDPRGIVWCDRNCRTEYSLCEPCPGLGCLYCD
jgi:cysteine-rich repeat protein